MATQNDVRPYRVVASRDERERRSVCVLRTEQDKDKGFAWSWMERVEPKQPCIDNLEVLAVPTAANGVEKEIILRPITRNAPSPSCITIGSWSGSRRSLGADELEELMTGVAMPGAVDRLVKEFDQRDGV